MSYSRSIKGANIIICYHNNILYPWKKVKCNLETHNTKMAWGVLNVQYLLWRTGYEWSRSVVSNSLQPVDYSPQSSSIHGILQARILEWVAISFSRGSSWPRDQTQVSHIAGRRFNLCTIREAKIHHDFLSSLILTLHFIVTWLSANITLQANIMPSF